MLDSMIVPTFNPELYYNRQLRGITHYPIYQSGRGLGSRLFNIVKTVGAPLLKEVILPTVKEEAGQVFERYYEWNQSEECTQAWSQTCWKNNFEKWKTMYHAR